ncbi:TrmB family transcriptional regulator [Streptomyces vinaceus]|uniref:TrmB family transcriptional regulator n=1 Tax=Streptomyces vinaceus TaxID=1960 RepID=A0A5J6IY99_STRVI|nr:helix-turn-helix domain-containing protein [Streptomyces vinaceus]QEV43937.1 TrmB family transcriptional regulator [Streptomyces vinaceus]GHE74675.1 TrmB family transcriptional regulator [Streptomyces vinaceus]
MELDDGAVNDLVSLGLSRYEARVYLALVRRESYTAAEAARAADVPRQRVYDVLDALVRRRLAVLRPGRVAAFSAVAPELALARLMAVQRESLERLSAASTALATALLPVWSDGRTHTDPLDYIEVLRDPRAIAERFDSIQEQAARELLSFCKPPFVAPPANDEGIRTVRRLRRAGGTARAVYTHDALGDAEVLENVRRFAAAGEESRFAPSLPLKLIVADASLVLCDMPDPVAGTHATTALYIEHPALAGCLRLAFLSVWEQARTAPTPGDDRADGRPNTRP